jgi:hypothetical protein
VFWLLAKSAKDLNNQLMQYAKSAPKNQKLHNMKGRKTKRELGNKLEKILKQQLDGFNNFTWQGKNANFRSLVPWRVRRFA